MYLDFDSHCINCMIPTKAIKEKFNSRRKKNPNGNWSMASSTPPPHTNNYTFHTPNPDPPPLPRPRPCLTTTPLTPIHIIMPPSAKTSSSMNCPHTTDTTSASGFGDKNKMCSNINSYYNNYPFP